MKMLVILPKISFGYQVIQIVVIFAIVVQRCTILRRNWKYEILCAIWYHLYNFKDVKNTPGGVLLL